MKKLEREYHGYQLSDGRKFRLLKQHSNKYFMEEYKEGKWIKLSVYFTRIKYYKDCLAVLESNIKKGEST